MNGLALLARGLQRAQPQGKVWPYLIGTAILTLGFATAVYVHSERARGGRGGFLGLEL